MKCKTPVSRILMILQSLDISKTQLANDLGISSNIKVPEALLPLLCYAIEEKYGYNKEWILTGKGVIKTERKTEKENIMIYIFEIIRELEGILEYNDIDIEKLREDITL